MPNIALLINSFCYQYHYLILFLDLLQPGHLFIGLVYALLPDMGPFARRLFQIFLTLLLPLLKCHLSVYNISEKYNQSLSTRQKIVCILTSMCLKEVSCFSSCFTNTTRIFISCKINMKIAIHSSTTLRN